MEDTARPRDGSRDFDFLVGRGRVHNRRLVHRLRHSNDWEEFEATVTARLVLGGLGNMDEFETTGPTIDRARCCLR